MLQKFTHTEGDQQVLKLGKKIAFILAFLFALGILAMVFVIFRGSQWLYNSYNQNGTEQNFALNPLPKIKEFFKDDNNETEVKETKRAGFFNRVEVISEQDAVIEVVKSTSPAVVSVVATAEVPRIERCMRSDTMPGLPPEFRDFFNFEVPGFCENGTETRRVGAGSGYIVSSDGFVITNKHVVSDEDAEYTVILNDADNLGEKVVAKVMARDPDNDIAVLKIDLKDLPFLELGDSDSLQVGQTAIAIGFALGEFDNTVSKGVVSGLSRNIEAGGGAQGLQRLRGLIQTDAAINPGNSGGPLLDLNGKVIGMNTAMANAQSIGFAIPANLVTAAYKQVKETGTIEQAKRAFLGVRYTPVTANLKATNNLPYDYGMLVVRGESRDELAVMPGSPADKVGLVENDIILEVDGRQLNERFLLLDAVQDKNPGEEVELLIFHRGEEKIVKVILVERD